MKLAAVFALLACAAAGTHAFDLKRLQGSWVTSVQLPLPSKSGAAHPPRIALGGRTRFDAAGNTLSVINASVEGRVGEQYETLISYAMAEQGRWSSLGGSRVSVESLRCTVQQTDRLPDKGNVPALRALLREIIQDACKPEAEVLELSLLDGNTIRVRQGDIEYTMSRADRDE